MSIFAIGNVYASSDDDEDDNDAKDNDDDNNNNDEQNNEDNSLEIPTTTPAQPQEEKPNCNCNNTNNNNTTNPNQPNKTQIIIGNSGFIDHYESQGQYVGKNYTEFYTPIKAFDNLIQDGDMAWSLWGQYGKSNFTVFFKEPLKDEICSVKIAMNEVNFFPFILKLDNKEFNGIANEKVNNVNLEKCIKGVSSIGLFFPQSTTWNLVDEVLLYSGSDVPNPEPCKPNEHRDTNGNCVPNNPPQPPANMTSAVFNFNGANVTMSMNNSTVSLDASEIVINLAPDNVDTGMNVTDTYNNITKPVSSLVIRGDN